MLQHILVSWISLHDIALSILLGNVVKEVPIIQHHLDLFKGPLSVEIILFLLLVIILFIGVLGIHRLVLAHSKHCGSDKVLRILGPDASLKLKVTLLTHRALDHRLDDCVSLNEYLVVI